MAIIPLQSRYVAAAFIGFSLLAGCALQPNYPNERPLGRQPRYLNGYYNNPFYYSPPPGIYEGPEQAHHEAQREEHNHQYERYQQQNQEGDQKDHQEERNEREGD